MLLPIPPLPPAPNTSSCTPAGVVLRPDEEEERALRHARRDGF
jgi:hypothetical protein